MAVQQQQPGVPQSSQQLLKTHSGRASIDKLSVDCNVSLYDDGKIFLNIIAKSTAKLYSRFSLVITLKNADDLIVHTIITPVENVKNGTTQQFNRVEQIPAALATVVHAIEIGGQEEGGNGSDGMANAEACVLL